MSPAALVEIGQLLVSGGYAEAEEVIRTLKRSGGGAAWGTPTQTLATALAMCLSCLGDRSEAESHRSAAERAQIRKQQPQDQLLALARLAAGSEREAPERGPRARSLERPRPKPLRYADGSGGAAATGPPAVGELPPQVAPGFAVHCLGPLRVYRGEARLRSWCSRRSKSVFKYLVLHRGRPVPNEVLMDLFWPEAAPAAARNSLHVAIHGLRRSLRAWENLGSPVLFQDNAYILNPHLDAWVDVEEFDRLVESARRFAQTGDAGGSMLNYQAAQALYQGDLFDDDPYEDWMLPRRRWLRDTYLGLLCDLGTYHLARAEYASCAILCRELIAAEPYREDAHRDLMRCYARQQQPYLALRQYRECAQALRIAFGGEPACETRDLYERILRGQPI